MDHMNHMMNGTGSPSTMGPMDHHQHHHGTMSPGSVTDGMDHGGMDHGRMDHGAMDHGGMNHSNGGHMMMMYFHAGIVETILFKFWTTQTAGAMVGSCFILFFVALLYEGLKVLREELLYKAHLRMQNHPRTLTQEDSDGTQNGARSDQVIIEQGPDFKAKMCNQWHLIQTFLHIFQVTVSYMLMLVFMTYNVWLCLAVVLGAGAGYFLFGWRKQTVLDVNEHCH